MTNMGNKTKAELIEIIKHKEDEILDLKDDLRQLEKCQKYDDITDEIRDVHGKLMEKGFSNVEALEITEVMISAGVIRKEPGVYRGGYVSYR